MDERPTQLMVRTVDYHGLMNWGKVASFISAGSYCSNLRRYNATEPGHEFPTENPSMIPNLWSFAYHVAAQFSELQ